MKNNIDFKRLRNFAENNPDLVRIVNSEKFPELKVLKYHRRVFFKKLWTPEIEEMRGLVVDEDWNPVVVPFKKIYNRFENNTDFDLNDEVIYVRKINGFMGALSFYKNKWIASSTGSLDSDYVKIIEEELDIENKDFSKLDKDYTYLFEMVSEKDELTHPIKEIPGIYLIGARNKITGKLIPEINLKYIADEIGFKCSDIYFGKFKNVVEEVKEVKHEGFVVHNSDGRILKIKSPYYLITKFFMRNNFKDGWENRIDDEEFFDLRDHILANLDYFKTLSELDKRNYVGSFLSR